MESFVTDSSDSYSQLPMAVVFTDSLSLLTFLLSKVKSHMGMPLNTAVDEQADVGLALDTASIDSCGSHALEPELQFSSGSPGCPALQFLAHQSRAEILQAEDKCENSCPRSYCL